MVDHHPHSMDHQANLAHTKLLIEHAFEQSIIKEKEEEESEKEKHTLTSNLHTYTIKNKSETKVKVFLSY